jgi:hypothetical protein
MSEEPSLYELLQQLDQLEELREDLLDLERDDEGDDEGDGAGMAALSAAMGEFGTTTLAAVEARIAELNAEIDRRVARGE